MDDNVIPDSWRLLPIGDLCRTVETMYPNQLGNDRFRYIDISSIDNRRKVIQAPQEILSSKAPSRARQIIATHDVLVSTVRPILNAVALVPPELDGSICSTGFCVLRPNHNLINSNYLFFTIQQPVFINMLVRLERGIGYPSVSDADVKSLEIPVPPLSEQRRIVAILRQADELRYLRSQINEKSQKFLPALLYEMFLKNKVKMQKWETVKIGNIVTHVTSGSRGWAKYYSDTGGKFIRVQDVLENELNLTDIECVQPPDTPEKQRALIQPDDLLISITGTIGRAAVAPKDIGEAYVSQHVAIARLDGSINPRFVSAYLNHPLGGKAQIEKLSYGQVKPGLNLMQIQSLKIPNPPHELVDEFERGLNSINKIQFYKNQSETTFRELFNSLLGRAFNGELTAHWREKHSDELQREATRRDAILAMQAGTSPDIDLNNEADRETFTQLVNINLPKAVDEFVGSIKRLRKKRREPLKDSAFVKLREFLEPFIESHGNFIYAKLFQTVQNLSETVRQALIGNIEPLFEIVPEFDTSMTFDLAHYIVESAAILPEAPDASHPRYAILAELSEEQYRIYRATQSAENYFTAENLEGLELPQAKIRETLTLLAAAGLILEVGLPTLSGNATVYTTAYRALRSQDSDAREADLQLLPQESA